MVEQPKLNHLMSQNNKKINNLYTHLGKSRQSHVTLQLKNQFLLVPGVVTSWYLVLTVCWRINQPVYKATASIRSFNEFLLRGLALEVRELVLNIFFKLLTNNDFHNHLLSRMKVSAALVFVVFVSSVVAKPQISFGEEEEPVPVDLPTPVDALGTDDELVHTRLGLLAGYLSKLII